MTDATIDPETYTWDPLDSELLGRLDLRHYVSMSRERRLNLLPTPLPISSDPDQAEHKFASSLSGRSCSPKSYLDIDSSIDLLDYIEAQDPERHSSAKSIFEAKTAGALTQEDVMRDIPLGQWKLDITSLNRTVRLQVRFFGAFLIPRSGG